MMHFKKGDHVNVTAIPSGKVEGATVNWARDEEIGVTYDTGGCNVIPLLPHAANAGIFSVALDKCCRSGYIKSRGNRR